MLEKLSAQAIYYRPQADGLTGISNNVHGVQNWKLILTVLMCWNMR